MLARDFWAKRDPLSAAGSFAVTPSDTADLAVNNIPHVALALYVTTGGAVKVTHPDGTVNTITVGDKSQLNVPVTRVWDTGTTATGIHALI